MAPRNKLLCHFEDPAGDPSISFLFDGGINGGINCPTIYCRESQSKEDREVCGIEATRVVGMTYGVYSSRDRIECLPPFTFQKKISKT